MSVATPTAPLVMPAQISECSLTASGNGQSSCLGGDDAAAVARAVGAVDMTAAREATGCTSEKCVVAAAAPKLGRSVAHGLITRNYKIEGPTDSTLLSNVNIDTILQQWTAQWPDFFAYNFNMLNYAQYNYQNGYVEDKPDTLATINVGELYKKGFRTAACVINSDKYQGGGIHWMCLFADMRDAGTATVEFFNSAGGCAAPEWYNWLAKAKSELEDAGIKTVRIINCGKVVHQDSMSECGVYSLFYIWSRLNGMAAADFQRAKIPDRYMFEFRQHLFAGPKAVDDNGKFNWEAYKATTKIEWQH